jgi:hypothetical protein
MFWCWKLSLRYISCFCHFPQAVLAPPKAARVGGRAHGSDQERAGRGASQPWSWETPLGPSGGSLSPPLSPLQANWMCHLGSRPRTGSAREEDYDYLGQAYGVPSPWCHQQCLWEVFIADHQRHPDSREEGAHGGMEWEAAAAKVTSRACVSLGSLPGGSRGLARLNPQCSFSPGLCGCYGKKVNHLVPATLPSLQQKERPRILLGSKGKGIGWRPSHVGRIAMHRKRMGGTLRIYPSTRAHILTECQRKIMLGYWFVS